MDASNRTKCILLDNQQCMTQSTLISLHLSEFIQGWFCSYPLAVNLDRCTGSCNAVNDLSDRVYVLNRIEDLNLTVLMW